MRTSPSLWVSVVVFFVACFPGTEPLGVLSSISSPNGLSRAVLVAEHYGGALGGYRYFIGVKPSGEYPEVEPSEICWASDRVRPQYIFWRSDSGLEVVISPERENFFDRVESDRCPEIEVVTTVAASSLKDDVRSAISLEEYLAQSGGEDGASP